MRRIVSYDKLYCQLICATIVFFLARNALPINDLFWVSWGMLLITSTILIVVQHKKIDIAKVKHILSKSKYLILCIFLYIIVDAINIFLGGISHEALSKYVIFVQGICILCSIMLANALGYIEFDGLLNRIYKWIFMTSIIIGIIVIVNYYYPLMKTASPAQISVINDYNAFCTFFVFSFVVSVFFLYNTNLNMIKKTILIILETLIALNIILLATSRRSIITMIVMIVILAVYIAILETKKYIKVGEKVKSIAAVVVVIAIIICTFGIANITSTKLADYNQENYTNKAERILETDNRDSAFDITKGLIKDDLIENVFLGRHGEIHFAYEPEAETTTAIERIENSESDLFGKRITIWNEAISELKTYTLKELIMGRGANYAIQMYETEPHATIISELYELDKDEEIQMHPHNYLLQDMLDGGIIKVFFALLATLGFGLYIFFQLLHNRAWIVPFLSMILVATNIMISYSVGFLGDTYYNVTMILAILLVSNMKENLKSCKIKRNV